MMALVIIAYNIIVYLTGLSMDTQVTTVTLISGAVWSIDVGDIIVFSGLVLLFLELISSTQTNASTIINHALSMLVLLVALVEFIVLPEFGNSTFFALVMLALFDVVAGFTVTITAARRDFTVGE
jgi:NAD/NADP transhydrogenase beta subunit